MTQRLVDVNKIEKFLHRDEYGTPDETWRPESEFAWMLDALPTVDAELIRHGHWISDPVFRIRGAELIGGVLDDDMIFRHYKCSRCGRRISCRTDLSLSEEFPYCNCGAKMDEASNG